MRIRPFFVGSTVAAALALSAAGCGESGDKPIDPTVKSAKNDCPDCDPAGPNAFVQSGIGDGFYHVGDTWMVAVSYRQSPLAEKSDVFLGQDVRTSDVYAFQYEVTALDKQVRQDVLRETAEVAITEVQPGGEQGDFFAQERVDQLEKKVVFELNDLLEPTRETVYSEDYPHGKTVELDSTESLQTGASLFPRTIPRLLVNGAPSPAPVVADDLKDVVDSMLPEWQTWEFAKYAFDNGDTVYWAKGQGFLWPFYAETAQGATVLVKWN